MTARPPIQSPKALEAYILHTVDEVTMREIARLQEVEPSTVFRQIRKIEDLQENSEWALILDQLALSWDRKATAGHQQIFEALGVEASEVTKEMQLVLPLLVQDEVLIGITDGRKAGIFIEGEIAHRTERLIATAWIAIGWLELVHSSPRVRRYRVTNLATTEVPRAPGELPVKAPKPVSKTVPANKPRSYTKQAWSNEPIDKLRKLAHCKSIRVTWAEIDTAQTLRYLMHKAELEGKGSSALILIVDLERRLGKEMFGLLYDFLHRKQGLEQIEKDYKWPARSAKIVLLVALRQINHFGILEKEEVVIG